MEAAKPAAPVGPRLLARLSAELILRSPQFMNAVGEYEIDLRANKITAIENLGATENQFDSVDLTDNGILMLDGFPKLPRLKTLLLNNNRIMRIARHLEDAIPNLRTLILTNNRLKNLSDLDPLSTLRHLQMLSLLDNEVTKQPNYRLYVIHRCKHLKSLDFKKVKNKDREAAQRLYGAPVNGEERTFEPGEGRPEAEAPRPAPVPAPAVAAAPAPAQVPAALGPEEITRIKAAIAGATTMEDIQRLEQALAARTMPSDLANGDGPTPMDEG